MVDLLVTAERPFIMFIRTRPEKETPMPTPTAWFAVRAASDETEEHYHDLAVAAERARDRADAESCVVYIYEGDDCWPLDVVLPAEVAVEAVA
jgi:hypothetical protein